MCDTDKTLRQIMDDLGKNRLELDGWPLPKIKPEKMGCYTCHEPIPYRMGGGYCEKCCPVTQFYNAIMEN